MAFELPTFNISVSIFDHTPFPPVTPRITVDGNLAFSRRVASPSPFGFEDEFSVLMFLLLPALTDVRDDSSAGGGSTFADFVEAPALSGRFYKVVAVDDIGKGFPNEHRCAVLKKAYDGVDGTGTFPGLFWPLPMP